MLWIGDGVLKHYYATFNILKRHKENKQTHTCVAVAQLKKHNLTLMDPKWHPYSHHPHCRATSNRMWRLSFSCISFLLYQVRMSPKAIEHLNLNFWNFTYYIYIYIFFHDCFSLMLFLHIPFILIHVFLLHSFFFFFCWWLFLVLFLWLLFIWGSNWKCRLGNQMTWFQILPASLILARCFASLWLTYKTEAKIMSSPRVGKGIRTEQETTLALGREQHSPCTHTL